jgi:hypothetical protein
VRGMGIYIMKEVWKDIKNYEGLYQVSNLGRVKSLVRSNGITRGGRKATKKEKILKNSKHGICYRGVRLRKDNKTTNFYIHRLVAEHFIPNYHNKKTVNHIDFDTTNNVVSNLEWASYKENIKHAWDNGACNPHGAYGESHGHATLKEKDVVDIYKMFIDNPKYNARLLALRYQVNTSTIYRIKNKSTWKLLWKTLDI